MAARTIRGRIKRGEVPFRNSIVRFKLAPGSYTYEDQYVSYTEQAITDDDGRFEVTLWANEEGLKPSVYICTLPDQDTFEFTLPVDGEAINLSLLRAVGIEQPNPLPVIFSYINQVIAAHDDDPDAHDGVPGSGGSGSGSSLQPVVLSGSAPMEVGRAYLVDAVSLVNLSLPLSAEIGDRLSVFALGDAGWRITQSQGQQIIVGDSATTIGITGAITSADQGDYIDLQYSGSVWYCISIHGNLSVI